MPNLIQLTDTHLFGDTTRTLYGVNPRDSLQAVLDDIRERDLPIDVVLVTGDCVHDEGEAAYQLLAGMLAGLGVPVHYLPGNHDTADIMLSVLGNAPDHGLHYFMLQSWMVVMLDSAVPGKVEGEVTSSTLERLQQLLQQHRDLPVLVAVHHHPVKVGSAWMDRIGLQNGEAFLQLLTAFPNVKLAINGHIHQPLAATVGQLHVFGTPSTCFQFKSATDEAGVDDAPAAYRYVQLLPDGRFSTHVYQLGTD